MGWRGGCARFKAAIRWVQKHLEGGEGRKVLVFSQEREVVDELAQALGEELGEGAAPQGAQRASAVCDETLN